MAFKRKVAAAAAASLFLAGCAVPLDAQPGTAGPPAPATEVRGPDPLQVREVVQEQPAAAPTSLSAPGLGTVPVDAVGLAADGSAEIPEDASRVGWYRFGSAPGESDGTVVLMGHRDFRGGKGALYGLRDIAVGTMVQVADAAGTLHSYRITSNESISKRVVPLTELFVRDGPARLVLISCGGAYVESQGGYLDNVVVTAERI